MEKLPEDFKQKWIAALRSGEYKQGTGQLYRVKESGEESFCCLGVAGVAAGMDLSELQDNCGFGINEHMYEVRPVDSLRVLANEEPSATLMRMNDDEGKSFSEIADWIQENL